MTLVSLDTRGFVLEVEAAGAFRSIQPPLSWANSFALIDKPHTRIPVPHLADPIGDWVGWAIGQLNENLWHLSAALPMLALRLCTAFCEEPIDIKRSLTPREKEVLWRLVSSMKVPQIAQELERSPYTVHDHVKFLHRKLNAKTRGELVAKALGHIKAGHDHVIGPVRAK